MPEPQNKQDLQYLLGMVNYLSQYIPNMSEITVPLHALLKKNTQLVLYDEHRSAIDKLKQALTNSPVLQYFNPDKSITIQTDASQNGIGSCLLQEGHPVIYASRSLTSAEQNYAQLRKNCWPSSLRVNDSINLCTEMTLMSKVTTNHLKR